MIKLEIIVIWELLILEKRSQGMQANELLENVRLDLWLERFWMFLENKKLLLT